MAGLATLAGLDAAVAAEPPSAALPVTETTSSIPMALPKTEFVYEAIVDLAPTLQLGISPLGGTMPPGVPAPNPVVPECLSRGPRFSH